MEVFRVKIKATPLKYYALFIVYLIRFIIVVFVFAGSVHAATSDPVLVNGLQDSATQEQLRQQERERQLRSQQEPTPDVRLQTGASPTPLAYPETEMPCFTISHIQLIGEAAAQFQFALAEVISGSHAAIGRCLGATGISMVISHMQNAVVARGFVTTRILAAPQDLKSGELALTVIPGRVREVRFAPGVKPVASIRNAVPVQAGDILNLRDIEQGLENFKRVPTAEADIQIVPAEGISASQSAPDVNNLGRLPAEKVGARQVKHTPGESDLVIRYQQRLPFRLSFSADDAGFYSTGKYQGSVTLSGDNLLSLNDLFYLSYTQDLGGGDPGRRGTKGQTLHYSLPYGYWLFGATASSYDYHQAVAGINQSYVYSGHSQNTEIKVSRMLYRNAINKTAVSLASFFKKSANYIDDTEVEVQRRRTAGWALGVNQSWYLGKSLLDYTLTYRRGTGAMQAMPAPEEAFGEGSSHPEVVTADITFNTPFTITAPWGQQALRYSSTVRGQYNYTSMAPPDRFAIGNRYTVRGFDGQLTLIGDHGWFMRNDLSAVLGSSGQAMYVGLDYGEVGGPSSEFLLGKQLAGSVVGLRGGYKGLSYDVFLGTPLKKPNGFDTAHTTAGFNLNWSF